MDLAFANYAALDMSGGNTKSLNTPGSIAGVLIVGANIGVPVLNYQVTVLVLPVTRRIQVMTTMTWDLTLSTHYPLSSFLSECLLRPGEVRKVKGEKVTKRTIFKTPETPRTTAQELLVTDREAVDGFPCRASVQDQQLLQNWSAADCGNSSRR